MIENVAIPIMKITFIMAIVAYILHEYLRRRSYSMDKSKGESSVCNICEENVPATQTYYGICLKCWHLMCMNFFVCEKEGIWNEDKNWSKGHIPHGLEIAIIPKGKHCISKGIHKHKYISCITMAGASVELQADTIESVSVTMACCKSLKEAKELCEKMG